jgi:hypothetical protein
MLVAIPQMNDHLAASTHIPSALTICFVVRPQLGVFTYGRPGQTFDDHSITLGDFTLRNGMSSADVEAGAGGDAAQLESAATRLIPTWQYLLYHVMYIPFCFTIFTLTTAFQMLPGPMLGISMLYNFGWWPSILASGLYGPLAFLILLAYLAVMKRCVMPHMAGQYPIFKSFKAAKWQMLALNAHIYGDFATVTGMVVSQSAVVAFDQLEE